MTYEDTTARDGTTSQATTIWEEELIEDEEMEKVSYFSLFPKLVYSSFLGRDFTGTEKEYTEILSRNTNRNSSNSISQNINVLEHPAYADIKNWIIKNLNNYRDNILNPKFDMEIYLTESWVNYTNQNEQHHPHKHSNSYLSGVFYLNAIDDDTIQFFQDENLFDIETNKYNLYNCPTWNYPVSTGQLILFPSGIRHGVPMNPQNKTRISLAFNTFLKGKISDTRTIGLKI